jgi:hypothetical protein
VVAGVAKRRGAREFEEGEGTAYREIRKGEPRLGPPRTQEEIYQAVTAEAQRRNPNDSPALAMSKYLETEEGQRVYQHYRDAPAGR